MLVTQNMCCNESNPSLDVDPTLFSIPNSVHQFASSFYISMPNSCWPICILLKYCLLLEWPKWKLRLIRKLLDEWDNWNTEDTIKCTTGQKYAIKWPSSFHLWAHCRHSVVTPAFCPEYAQSVTIQNWTPTNPESELSSQVKQKCLVLLGWFSGLKNRKCSKTRNNFLISVVIRKTGYGSTVSSKAKQQ